MYSEGDLEDAVAAGAVSADAVAALRAHVAGKRHAPVVDEEHFRLLTGFVIGASLLLLSAGWHRVRAAIVRGLPPDLAARLPYLDAVPA